tara:strand:- start:6009 stop:6875 length:867 start_codon:yes stop_codon:yes gene_type:complete
MPKDIQKDKKKIYKKLKNHYRLVILNDDTFEERVSLRLTPMNVFTWGGLTVVSLIALTISIIAFTPLREYIPGYADLEMKKKAAYASFKSDSLNNELRMTSQYLNNIQAVLSGEPPTDTIIPNKSNDINYANVEVQRSMEDSIFRSEIEQEEKYSINSQLKRESTGSYFFFSPIEGLVSSKFNPDKKHYGVDIVAKENESIKAVLDGTVILSEWTSDNGHIIQVQHGNNLISVYKHCSVLLKKSGVQVKAGEAIAIVGNSGTETTGPHLHFELWENGSPVDPQQYISF